MTKPVRLNVGCGGKRLPKYLNIDHPESGSACDLTSDMGMLPFEMNTVDEILSVHSIEHLFRHEAISVIEYWVKLLKSGGLLAIECPDLDRVVDRLAARVPDPCQTTWALYGHQDEIRAGRYLMQHKWCWRANEMIEVMTHAGLVDVRQEVAHFHDPARDMRVTGRKP